MILILTPMSSSYIPVQKRDKLSGVPKEGRMSFFTGIWKGIVSFEGPEVQGEIEGRLGTEV